MAAIAARNIGKANPITAKVVLYDEIVKKHLYFRHNIC